MTRRAVLLTLVLGFLVLSPTAAAAPPLPTSMAAIGDSITRATDVCCWYGDHPGQSWSTGGGAFDGIRSHYERIRAAEPGIGGHNYNNARAGAKMSDASGQAQTAVAQGARYVTVLMGGNDVCTDSISTMTTVADFRAQFSAAMGILAAGLPSGSHVFVSSIPDVYQLWALFHTNASAQLIWSLAGICQSMLSPFNTEQDRQTVRARNQEFNTVLAQVCGAYAFCRFDDLTVFEYRFTSGQVTRLDYFHPSMSGQAALASITWARSWWGT
jgi:lysophospholipase L1-like esterase